MKHLNQAIENMILYSGRKVEEYGTYGWGRNFEYSSANSDNVCLNELMTERDYPVLDGQFGSQLHSESKYMARRMWKREYEAILNLIEYNRENNIELLPPIRMDKQIVGHSYDIVGEILENIKNAGLLIADLTYENANVYYEVGYAQGLINAKIGNTADVLYSSGRNNIYFKCMRAKLEHLRVIDDYFSRFGYVTNLVKVPNITGRRYWNYVQIGGSEIIGTGNVPEIYMDSINRACRNGTTIWHNHANIGNYNLNNAIV